MSYLDRVAEIRARAQRKSGNLYDTYFTRRVSAFLTAALAPTGISPNAVSWANIVVGIALCLLIAFGRATEVVAGALLVHLYAILDSVDGELARLTDRRSLVGVFLENWSAYLMINGFLIAIGNYLSRSGQGRWPLWMAIAIAAFGRSAAPAVRRTILETRASPRSATAQFPELSATERGLVSRAGRFLDESLLFQTNVWVVLSTLVLLERLFHLERWRLVLVGFVFYALGAVAKELGVIALATGTPHLERELERKSRGL